MLTGANNAYYQHSERSTGKHGNPNKVGEGGTYSWSNKSQITWDGASWRGYKPSRQRLPAQRANSDPAKKGATRASGDPAVYWLQEGTFAGGQFVQRKGEKGLEAELTMFGSGVPITASERGSLSKKR